MLVFQGIDNGVPWVGPTTGGVVTAQTMPQGYSGYGSSYSLSTIRRYDSAGVALDAAPVPIVQCGNPEVRPAVAWNGSHYLVVWEDDRNGPDADLYGVRIAADGTVVDQMAIPISTAPSAQTHPNVVSDGTKFFVVWDDYRAGSQTDIYGTFVDAAGVVSSPGGILVESSTINEWEPVAAAGGGRFFVAWKNGSNDVEARLLDSNASGLGPAFIVAPNSGLVQQPHVSYGDSKFIVTFGRSARRYDLTGTAVDTTAITLSPYYGAAGSLGASDISWLFTFTGDYPVNGVSARRVAFDGSLPNAASSLIHATTTGWIWNPTAAWDSEQFLVVWQEPTTTAYAAPQAVYAKRVTSEAEPVESTPVALTNPSTTVTLGGVAAGPPGSFLVVFDQWEAAVPYVNDRARALLVTVDGSPSGTLCASGSECKSGLCIDGVCCRVRCGDGATGDCEACSVSAGGFIDGTCTAIAVGPVCRPATGECDVTDVCDGTNRVCPPDQTINDGTVCSGGMCSGGVCMPPLPDAGTPDAATPDTAMLDAAMLPPDAPSPDAPPPDAPSPDAPPDASPVDAQMADASANADAAGVDDATVLDASNTDADADVRSPRSDTGCGCRLGHQDGFSGIVWLPTLMLLVRRRRRRARLSLRT
jgi:MYXO-CTERM domain-containing protein